MDYRLNKFKHIFKRGGCLGIFNNSLVGFGTYNTTNIGINLKVLWMIN